MLEIFTVISMSIMVVSGVLSIVLLAMVYLQWVSLGEVWDGNDEHEDGYNVSKDL